MYVHAYLGLGEGACGVIVYTSGEQIAVGNAHRMSVSLCPGGFFTRDCPFHTLKHAIRLIEANKVDGKHMCAFAGWRIEIERDGAITHTRLSRHVQARDGDFGRKMPG
jgi:hypothetical protein